jgi:hypothetical protein
MPIKWAFDTETYQNIHIQVYQNLITGEIVVFEISKRRDDTNKLREFYLSEGVFVGFNNMTYDHPLTMYIISKSRTTKQIKKKSDWLISNDFLSYNDKSVDLRRILHLDNVHRSASLKFVECNLCSPDIRDLPFAENKVLSFKEFDELISYCKNDVRETIRLYETCKNAIDFRIQLMSEMGLPNINYSDVKIGTFINQKIYRKHSDKPFIKGGTPRPTLAISDLIPDQVVFKTPYFQKFLETIKAKTLIVKEKGCTDPDTGKDFSIDLTYKKVHYNFKVGGLHSEDKKQDIISTEDQYLLDKDVASMYPNTCANYGYYPEHLGVEWLIGYRQTIETRLDHKHKAHDESLSKEERNVHSLYADALKLSLNGAYGKTNSQYDWQYDPKVTYSVTFTGQLCMLMLIERLGMADITVVSANTDGVLLYVKKGQEKLLTEICEQWMNETMYELEDTFYSRYFAKNVNNYIAIKTDGKVKQKRRI